MAKSSWRNRIVGYGEVEVASVLENERNWRLHPDQQAQALDALMTQVGIVQNVIINKRTGPDWPDGQRGVERMLDGHLRLRLAVQKKQRTLPVTYVDLDPKEEALVLAALDPLSAMAATDNAILAELMRQLEAESEALNRFLQEIAQQPQPLPEPDADPSGDALREIADEMEGAYTLKPDMRFPSSQPFGIPELRADRLLELPEGIDLWPGDDLRETVNAPAYMLCYGTSCRTLDFTRAVLAFYTDDARFESVWNYPDKMAMRILNAGLVGAVAPNYSLWPGQALAVHIWNTYRSRWVGRYFQEAGISVVPDVNWSGPEDYDFCFAGIPMEAPCISIQVQTFRSNQPDEVRRVVDGIAEALRRLRPQRVLFYASKAGRQLIGEHWPGLDAVILPTLMDRRRDKLRRQGGLT